MKVHKVEILIIDFDGLEEEGVKSELENTRYPNDCMSPHVMSIESREIGAWTDDNPLNFNRTIKSEYERLFGNDDKIQFLANQPTGE